MSKMQIMQVPLMLIMWLYTCAVDANYGARLWDYANYAQTKAVTKIVSTIQLLR